MTEGTTSSVLSARLNPETHILEPKCSCLNQNNSNNSSHNNNGIYNNNNGIISLSVKFEQDFSTSKLISRTPKTPDPWEVTRYS